MKVFVLLLLGLQAILIGAASAKSVDNEFSDTLGTHFESYCLAVRKGLQDSVNTHITINKFHIMAVLEKMVAELQNTLEDYKEKSSECETKIEFDDELAEIHSKIDKVTQNLEQITSDKIVKEVKNLSLH